MNYTKNSYILLINKERSISSQRTISKIKKELQVRKIGFAGTLDPEAQGLLVVGVNRGTKYLNTFENSDKEYMVEMEFGYETTTLDVEGEIVERSNVIPFFDEINEVINQFIGKQKQVPPIYSAIKKNGVRSYQRARNGEEFSLPTRDVEIKEISNVQYSLKKLSFTVMVSKGTYIRSLVRDLAYKLGTFATMTKLVRTKVGPFLLENAVNLDDLYAEKSIIKITDFHLNNQTIKFDELSETKQKAVRNGNALKLDVPQTVDFVFVSMDDEVKMIYKFDKNDKIWVCETNLW